MMIKHYFILFFILISNSSLFYAQDNLVINGDFEDSGFDVFSYESKTNCVIFLPGWNKQEGIEDITDGVYNNEGLYRYNIRATMQYENPASAARGHQYLRIQKYEWNGNQDGGIYQTIDVEPLTSYVFTFQVRISKVTTGSGILTPFYQIQYYDSKSETWGVTSKTNITNPKDESWFTVTRNITSGSYSSKIRIMIGATGSQLSSGTVADKDKWLDVDNVKLTKKSE